MNSSILITMAIGPGSVSRYHPLEVVSFILTWRYLVQAGRGRRRRLGRRVLISVVMVTRRQVFALDAVDGLDVHPFLHLENE